MAVNALRTVLSARSRHANIVAGILTPSCRLLLAQRQNRCIYSHAASKATNGVDAPDVRKLAKMAHISVTEDEIREWEPQLQQIVSWFDQLQAVDVEGIPPAVRIDMEDQNVLRPDAPIEYHDREAVLSQVPEKEGAFVKVPKIL